MSARLHQWIDLIFGFKQGGDNAVKFDNLYHPKSYEGNINLDAIAEPFQRRALKDQINEFGQTPKQVFFAAHPQRKSRQAVQKEHEFALTLETKASVREKAVGDPPAEPERPLTYNLAGAGALKGVKNVTAIQFLKASNELALVDDNQFRVFNLETQAELRCFPLNSDGALVIAQASKGVFILGNSDGSITVFNSVLGLSTQRLSAHKNKVTALLFLSSFVD